MPIPWLMDYWDKMADKTLPYLVDRRVAVQQNFDGKILYRRHMLKSKRWIHIKEKKDMMFWAKLHTFSFHSHLEGEETTFFAMDIDKRSKKMDFECMKIAAHEMAKIIEENGINFICKFSGGNGWHFFWAFKNSDIKGLKIFEVEQKIISRLTALLEDKIQRSDLKKQFYKYIKKGDPIFIVNSQDKDHPDSILIDELILKRRGVIRSLWSVHPATNWISRPVETKDILNFNPKTSATAKATMAIKKDYPICFNKIGDINKKLEL
ncbi:MAG: hypothetical protein NT039_01750 [Candidatus Berkelbacteria bacterium]|nr:hypothetical protein [Candidatus Berkelbacteria bacterium]